MQPAMHDAASLRSSRSGLRSQQPNRPGQHQHPEQIDGDDSDEHQNQRSELLAPSRTPSPMEGNDSDQVSDLSRSPSPVRDSSPSQPRDHKPEPQWLPYTLRWPWLSLIIAFPLGLELVIIIFHSISVHNSGLVDLDGSPNILLASRFVPTLLAVLYVLSLSVLLDDIKRTEPFARLASAAGAPANKSLTWKAGPWWTALGRSFPGPQGGLRTSWAMFWSAFAFMLGSLVVSPLSSTLMVAQNVVFTQRTDFSLLDINASLPLQASPLSTTYFRTVSNVLQNVSTSAWITDNYAVLPAWPEGLGAAPLGPVLSTESATWRAAATVFGMELYCEPLTFERHAFGNFTYPSIDDDLDCSIVTFSSPSGCTAEYRLLLSEPDFYGTGAAAWTTVVDQDLDSIQGVAYAGAASLVGNVSFVSCESQDEIIAMMSALPSRVNGPLAENFTAGGQVCQTTAYMAESVPVEVTLGAEESVVSIDKAKYNSSRVPLHGDTADMHRFREVFFSMDWPGHVATFDITGHQSSSFLGPMNLLNPLYGTSPTEALSSPNLTANMQRTENRFFAELLRDAFDNNTEKTPQRISGDVITDQRRLVVVQAVAITLEVVIGIQLILLATILAITRLSRRPLGLYTDPAPAVAVAGLLANDRAALQSIRDESAGGAPKSIEKSLSDRTYRLVKGDIILDNRGAQVAPQGEEKEGKDAQDGGKQAKPVVFSIFALLALVVLLLAVLAAIATLYAFSRKQSLYQSAFVYALDIKVNGKSYGQVNPASIITTLLGVCVSLWWGALDSTLRQVQPFLALASKPVRGWKGIDVSYGSSYLLWATQRAARRGHWVLSSVCTGAFFTQIFTVAMSSLWTREPGELLSTTHVLEELELRHVPRVEPGRLRQSTGASDPATFPLWDAFGDTGTSWMSTAAVQLSLNGSEPSWSSDGWSLIPRDLSALLGSETQQQSCVNGTACLTAQSLNVTMRTSAVRARLQCTPYDFLDETPIWLTEWDLTDATYWNISASPRTIDHGYELGYATYNMTDSCSTGLFLNGTEGLLRDAGNYTGDVGAIPDSMTPFFVDVNRLICCQNSSSDGQIQSASIGYWSPNIGCGSAYPYPYISDTWPNNFTIKWIHGRPVEGYRRNTSSPLFSGNSDDDLRLIWAEKPQMTAMNCQPTIETANASATVEASTGRVISLRILDEPRPDPAAWSDNFAVHQYYPSSDFMNNMAMEANITVSYGVLFMTALLGAADISNFQVNGVTAANGIYNENLRDQAFNMRGPGLNVDYMTYSMLSLANGSHEAMLDPLVLGSTAERTFEVMFQHFAQSGLDMESGGNVYQNASETLAADIDGPTTTATSTTAKSTTAKSTTATSKTRSRRQEGSATASATAAAATAAATDIPDTARVEVRREVEILRMSTIAAIICMSILAYLIVTSVVLAMAARRYNKLLPVKVDSIADVAVLVAGSDRLLELARQKGSQRDSQLKSGPEGLAKLGWFNGADGELRWGIELVDPNNVTSPTGQKST